MTDTCSSTSAVASCCICMLRMRLCCLARAPSQPLCLFTCSGYNFEAVCGACGTVWLIIFIAAFWSGKHHQITSFLSQQLNNNLSNNSITITIHYLARHCISSIGVPLISTRHWGHMQVFQSNSLVCIEMISVFRESSISGNYACKGISCPLCPDTNSRFLFLCIDYFTCYEHRMLCSLSLKMCMLGVSLCLLVIASALLTQTDCHCYHSSAPFSYFMGYQRWPRDSHCHPMPCDQVFFGTISGSEHHQVCPPHCLHSPAVGSWVPPNLGTQDPLVLDPTGRDGFWFFPADAHGFLKFKFSYQFSPWNSHSCPAHGITLGI